MLSLSILKIAASLLFLLLTMLTTKRLGAKYQWHVEIQRKLIHTSVGAFALCFPFIFNAAWEVFALCLCAILLFAAVRRSAWLMQHIGSALHSVPRSTLGEVFFAFSIALLFFLSGDQPILYLLPILVLTVGDAAASLVGIAYGKTTFSIEGGQKSWEGTVIFFLLTWLLSIIVLLVFSDIPRQEVIAVGLLLAVFGSLIEAASWKGLDNVFVPVGLFLLVKASLLWQVETLVAYAAALLVFISIGVLAAKRWSFSKQAMTAMIVALFFFWIVGGIGNIFAPLAVFLTHIAITRGRDVKSDNFIVVLSIISTALLWYVFAMTLQYNTHYVYDLSFGIHFLLLIMIAGQLKNSFQIAGLTLFAWLIAILRLPFIENLSERSIQLSLVSLAVISLAAISIRFSYSFFESRRWLKQALVAFSFSFFGVIATWLA